MKTITLQIKELDIFVSSGETLGLLTISEHERLIQTLEKHAVIINSEERLIKTMTIAENLFVLNKKTGMIISKKSIEKQANTLLKDYGVPLKPGLKIYKLNSFGMYVIQLIKSQLLDKKVVVIENISVTKEELDFLSSIITSLKNRGMSFIYISHFFDSPFSLCDRVSIIKDDCVIKNFYHLPTSDEIKVYN